MIEKNGQVLDPHFVATLSSWGKAVKKMPWRRTLVKQIALQIFWSHAVRRWRPSTVALSSSSLVSTLLYDCESWKLSEKVRRKLNATCSNRLSKLTAKEIADKARTPAVDVLFHPRHVRWNGLGYILRMDERRLVRQMLLSCVKPTPEPAFGDLIDPDINAAIGLANDRIMEKEQALEAMLAPFGEQTRNYYYSNIVPESLSYNFELFDSPLCTVNALLLHAIVSERAYEQNLRFKERKYASIGNHTCVREACLFIFNSHTGLSWALVKVFSYFQKLGGRRYEKFNPETKHLSQTRQP